MVRRAFERMREHVRNASLHPLQRLAVIGIFVLVGLSLSLGSVGRLAQQQLEFILSAVLPGVIVDLTNGEREAQAVGQLRRNPALDASARLKAEHMRDHNYFAHYAPDDGLSPWYFFDLAGYRYVHAGENLAVYFTESKDVVDAWMDSPLHKANILKPEYTEIGVAAVPGEYKGYETIYVVQHFGTPALPTPPPVPSPAPIPSTPNNVPEPVGIATNSAEDTEPVVVAVAPEDEAPILPLENTPPPEPLTLLETTPMNEETEATEPAPPTPLETPTTTIERVTLEKATVYLSGHIATTTTLTPAPVSRAPQALGVGLFVPEQTAPVARTMLQMLFVALTLMVAGLLVASVVDAERRLAHAQTFYGAGLLGVTLLLVYFHVVVVETAAAFL